MNTIFILLQKNSNTSVWFDMTTHVTQKVSKSIDKTRDVPYDMSSRVYTWKYLQNCSILARISMSLPSTLAMIEVIWHYHAISTTACVRPCSLA